MQSAVAARLAMVFMRSQLSSHIILRAKFLCFPDIDYFVEMNALSRDPDSAGHREYMLGWLESDTSHVVNSGGPSLEDQHYQGFAAHLYSLCLNALQQLYRGERRKDSLGVRSTTLRECLGELYLWGDAFRTEELDKALDQSDEMRDTVLEQFVLVGEVLLRGKLIKQIHCRF